MVNNDIGEIRLPFAVKCEIRNDIELCLLLFAKYFRAIKSRRVR